MEARGSTGGKAIYALRPVETIFVPHPTYGKALVLRDTEGLTAEQVTIPGPLVPIVARFDGRHTPERIAREVSAILGEEIPELLVQQIAEKLDHAYFLESPRGVERRRIVTHAFRQAPIRAAEHAGGAYPGERDDLRAFLEQDCFERARSHRRSSVPPPLDGKKRDLVALVAPHIDPYRGAVGYGRAYGALADSLPDSVDTFVLVGTSHAPMEEPFALTRKGFDTPLGLLECDHGAVDFLAKRARFDAFGGELNHKREHSIEFQAVLLKHVLTERRRNHEKARIIPILASLGEAQTSGREPEGDGFFDALAELAHARHNSLVFIIGADLAHVGPRFGDRFPLDEAGRAALEETDRASLAHALAQDASRFWEHVQGDLDQRRVCGLAPIYTLLRSLTRQAEGRLVHYEQNVDPQEGSIVSFASAAYYTR